MILDALTLHNFGQYKGEQTLELTPTARNRPIVLLGGLNGGGKTTVLDALQLALYGKLAQCSARQDLPYEEFLARSIHRGCDPRDGAALELKFRHTSEGLEHAYCVRRSWKTTKKGVREHLEIVRDGVLDAVLTDAWSEQVEEFIPVRLSSFFFFDGEKIEALADVQRSSEVLSTAIHALLGLDLVDQLGGDLLVLERRKRTERMGDDKKRVIEDARLAMEAREARRLVLVQQRAAAQNSVDRAQKHLAVVEGRFRAGGGEALERRTEIEERLRVANERLADVRHALGEMAEGAAPLLLVPLLLKDLFDEESLASAGQLVDAKPILAARDRRILERVQSAKASKATVDALRKFLQADLSALLKQNGSASLSMTPHLRRELAAVQATLVPQVRAEISRTVEQAERFHREIQKYARQLASAPDRESVAALSAARADAQRTLESTKSTLAVIGHELADVTSEFERKQDAYHRLMESDVEARFQGESAERMLRSSAQVRNALAKFRGNVVDRHVRRIEQLVLESFKHLLRKESLIGGLRIDSRSFALSLLDDAGNEIPAERLSAGERQLMAISLIWGLARASGRPIPVVIDTPLGRLDSIHRDRLVTRYFPNASHQVVLLSTDEEIDREQYEKLRGAVGRTYTLRFDDSSKATSVDPGYFWS